MKIKTVHYLATINLGNYSNERIGFTADIESGEDERQAIEILRQKVKECSLPNIEDVQREIYKSQTELSLIQSKLAKLRTQWDATAEFLRKKGIKTDAVDMPQFSLLLPSVSDEQVIEGEVDPHPF